ncbi:hypothetical protein AAGW05_05780 [Arthrobacter sp. LAPM80]|uniref:hypothetical protein n=1 Tax=Arthrobacter sp. LAPM80 TaxID=3141788 RepID=UPI00398B0BCA
MKINESDTPQAAHGKQSSPAVQPATHPARVGTVVWGAVVVVMGILVIGVRQSGLSLDAGQTAMWLLLGAGVAMVAGGAINILRKKQP